MGLCFQNHGLDKILEFIAVPDLNVFSETANGVQYILLNLQSVNVQK